MNLQQRLDIFERIFNDLQDTNSRLEKERIVSMIPDELREDWLYILEILAGKHKLGYTYRAITAYINADMYKELTLKEYFEPLFEPIKSNNFTDLNVLQAMSHCQYRQPLIASIVNRTLRLGIGPSQLPKDGLAPMLAKKFEDCKLSNGKFFVTEKLDGNRCIAKYDGEKWLFISRNGKPLKVNIDMGNLPTDVVYDGELLSITQTTDSTNMHMAIKLNYKIPKYANEFNSTSGLINSKQDNKKLVYNIFDVMTDEPYNERRKYLNRLEPTSMSVRILPTLAYFDSYVELEKHVPTMLDMVTNAGAEGLMINRADSKYIHKRTDQLIKVKNTYTMDMLVIETIDGTGKYDGQVGSLFCTSIIDGKTIEANVGAGLTDEQRLTWALHPELIVGQIVEVAYFSVSQNSSTYGSKNYSLRFPRLKQVRLDKDTTSID